MIRVQAEDFDIGRELERLSDGNLDVGGVSCFIGLVRDMAGDTPIKAMTLEHYPEMTEKALAEIEAEAAVLFLDRGAQHARIAQRLPRFAGDDAVFLVLVEVRGHMFGKDLAHGVAEGLVVFVIGEALAGIEHRFRVLS